ncbi:hypothetical protein PIB30_059240, partial [Stylosanthes scabra]|nr:hypothetical protein [Stylosanthes scabra]
MASKGKAPAKASSTRARGSTSQQQPLLEVQLYETPTHAERAKILEERKVIHERLGGVTLHAWCTEDRAHFKCG